jgi:peptide/nickel transport system substrate-binding protein
MTNRTWRFAALAAVMLWLVQPASAAQRPTLTLGVQGSPRTLEPLMDNSNVLWRIGYNVFDTLIRVDYKDGGKLVPGLAKEWTRVSPTELDFTLRDDVKFHNGETMTADDVAFTFGEERAFGEKAPGAPLARAFIGTIAKVEAVAPFKVRVTTKQPDPLIEARGWPAGPVRSSPGRPILRRQASTNGSARRSEPGLTR